jgi:hypothetical protein
MENNTMAIDTASSKNRLARHLGAIGALMLGSCLIVPSAHAQWKVVDDDANQKLGDLKDSIGSKVGNKTTNGQLDSLNTRLDLNAFDDKKPGDRMGDPSEALPKANDTAATLDDGKHCDNVAPEQQETCKKIVAIENAQYKYMLTVYETSGTRNTTLRQLLDERKGLKSTEYGKLEDNTNKLTALYNLIALDRQQMDAVNYAYEANLRYLRAVQAQKAESAQSGAPTGKVGGIDLPIVGTVDVGNIIKSLTTGVVLQAALNESQTPKPDGMQRLTIGRSDSWW